MAKYNRNVCARPKGFLVEIFNKFYRQSNSYVITIIILSFGFFLMIIWYIIFFLYLLLLKLKIKKCCDLYDSMYFADRPYIPNLLWIEYFFIYLPENFAQKEYDFKLFNVILNEKKIIPFFKENLEIFTNIINFSFCTKYDKLLDTCHKEYGYYECDKLTKTQLTWLIVSNKFDDIWEYPF